ncbi:phage protease [Pannonibacter sp. SL95]|uniref:phage protease n=1 Tax=Pannonibacter sp. SL95 TaxID=2995153 RepID=UPI0022743DE7|nr:phage protease [Pannonibacter sp. SL95]MCY1705491.1 hypothetical protein [Pannonibacter sp. SL95]
MMTPRSLHCLSAEMASGLTVVDAFAADPDAVARQAGPASIKIAPRGRFTARDGRVFDVDPEVLVARFAADGVHLPIDLDHATVRRAAAGEAAPAVGWVTQLEARADGLYGAVDWLDEGLRILTARTHRYISPVLQLDDTKRAIWLHSAALVAAPAVSMPAVASADPSPQEHNMPKEIALALGLSPDAGETSCLSAITTLKARVDPAVHAEALARCAQLTADLAARDKAAHDAKVAATLEGALKARKIVPAQRAAYEALCATPEGLAQVEALLETFGAALTPSRLDAQTVPAGELTGDLATLSAEDREVMRQMGLSEDEYRKANGLTAA